MATSFVINIAVVASSKYGPRISSPARSASMPATPGRIAKPTLAAPVCKPMATDEYRGPTRLGVSDKRVGKIADSDSPINVTDASPPNDVGMINNADEIIAPIMLMRNKRVIPILSAVAPKTIRPTVNIPQNMLVSIPAK